jgi:hypothetical protein
MTEIAETKGEQTFLHRVLVCQTLNQWNYPAKDRSGRLDLIEEAHLGRLIAKIGEPGRSPLERLVFGRPAPVAPGAAASQPKSNI